MFTLKGIILIIVFMYFLKISTFIFNKIFNYKDEKIQFYIDMRKERIESMSGYEFEGFCKWLFQGTGEYSNVELTSDFNDEGNDLILTSNSGEKVYVQCKRYSSLSEEELENMKHENLLIGRSLCQKFVGSMISENITTGIIVTTGSVNKHALDYIEKINSNTTMNIDILTMNDIVTLIENNKENELYSVSV